MKIEYRNLMVQRYEGTNLCLLKKEANTWVDVCYDLPEKVAVRFFEEAVRKGARLRTLRELAITFTDAFGDLC